MRLEDDDFTLFGLPPVFGLDSQDVDRRWRALQAEVHPDRFASQGAAAQRLAMQWAVRVNEAHQRLRDPVSRAAYLCELRGCPVQAQGGASMTLEFLEQQMTWRQALETAPDQAALAGLERELQEAERQVHQRLTRQLDAEDRTTEAVHGVREWMFMRRFRQDLERRLDDLPI